MDRVVVKNGTQQDIYDVFEDLQDNVETEFFRLCSDLFQEYGVVAETISGVIPDTDLSLKITEGVATNTVLVNPGVGMTSNGTIIRVADPGETFTISGEGTHTLYIKNKYINTEFVEYQAGFQYGAGTASIPSRSATAITLTETDPTTSGILLADVVLAGVAITSIDDRRDENLLRLKLALYDEGDVVLTNQGSTIDGDLQVNGLAIKSTDSDNILTVEGTLSVDSTCSLSGIQDAHDWAHTHAADTFIPQNVTTTHTALNNLMTYGVINYADGGGDRLILTEKIPSQPNTVSGITSQAYQLQQNTTFGNTLLSDIALYKTANISMVQETQKRGNLYQLAGKLNNWVLTNSGLAWEDAWASADIVDAYGHTLSGLAQTIVDYNNATAGEVGLTGPSVGSTVADLVTHVTNGGELADNERSILSNSAMSVANKIGAQAERVASQPELIRPDYKIKVSWSAPALVGNEAITSYAVKIFKVTESDWSPAPTQLEMITVAGNVQGTLDIVQTETVKGQKASSTIATKNNTSMVSTTSYVLNSVTLLQVGDFVGRESDMTDKSQVRSIDAGTNTVVFSVPFSTTLAISGENLVFYRVAYEDTDAQRSYWIPNVGRDQYYIVYVRPISEYGVYGPWSEGTLINVNNQTVDGVPISTLLDSRDEIIKNLNDAQQTSLVASLESTVAELQKQIVSQPDMVAVNNLSAAYTSLKNQVDSLS